MSPADKEAIRAFCLACDAEDMRWSEERTVEAVAALVARERRIHAASLPTRSVEQKRRELLDTAAVLMGGNEGAQAKIWSNATDLIDAPAFVSAAAALIAAVDAAMVPK